MFSNSFLFDEAMRLWEVPAVAVKDVKDYEVGIVLGNSVSYDPHLDRIQFLNASDRILQAVELYKKGKIKKIVYCGGSGSVLHPESRDGDLIKRYLMLIGIPEQDVFFENESHNTHENAAFAKPIITRLAQDNTCLLITSASHMRRSLRCFEKLGIHVDPYSTDRMSGPRKFELDHLFLPNGHILANWYFLNHELVGCIAYKLAGYI